MYRHITSLYSEHINIRLSAWTFNRRMSYNMIPFEHSFSAIIAAPSRGGKTTFIKKLIKHRDTLIKPKPEMVIYCYTIWQKEYDELEKEGVKFNQGMIDVESLDTVTPKLLVLDDMLHELSSEIAEVFTKHAHHRNMSVIFPVQNVYDSNKHMRTCSLNATHIVLFANRRDKGQIQCLARQIYPRNQKYLLDSHQDAITSQPYGYLIVDLSSSTEDLLRLRTGIFPGEKSYVYMPRSASSSLPRFALQREVANS